MNYKADATGQLNFLEPETTEEPPDPDDFDSIEAFREAMREWDAENSEPLAVSMDSMCEWAPCPDEWYEPEAENLPLKAPSMLELPPVSVESSSTCNFSIPVFGGFADRTNGNDEPRPQASELASRCRNLPVSRRWLSLRAMAFRPASYAQTAKSLPAAQYF